MSSGFTKVKEEGGKRKVEVTGAVREAISGKGRYDLIPPYPMERLAQHYENGAIKYADRNWEKGLPLHRFLESGLRHAFLFMAGKRDEDHLAAVIWNFFGYVHTEKMIMEGKLPSSLYDVPWAPSIPGVVPNVFPLMATKVLRQALRSLAPRGSDRRAKGSSRKTG